MHTELSEIRVKNLRLRTFIGFNTEEREKLQDVIINARISYDATAAATDDDVASALDYKRITKKMIAHVEHNHFLLLEKLVADLLAILMGEHGVARATVEVDKPHALRFADSVSIEQTAYRDVAALSANTPASSANERLAESWT